jgi:hypothetical protein
MIPRTLTAFNCELEGHLFGLDQHGELFASVTAAAYPFSFIDARKHVSSKSTIFLRTNLNNIYIAQTKAFASDLLLVNASKARGLGCFSRANGTDFEDCNLLLHSYEGQVTMLGQKEVKTECTLFFAAFSSFLAARHSKQVQDKRFVNSIESEVVGEYLKLKGDRQLQVYDDFVATFDQQTRKEYPIFESFKEFLAQLTNLV